MLRKNKINGEPKPFGELSDAEQSALLLADHRREAIEAWIFHNSTWSEVISPSWYAGTAYRIKPQPVVREVKVALGMVSNVWQSWEDPASMGATHRITFDTLDGEPVLDSIKMEKAQ